MAELCMSNTTFKPQVHTHMYSNLAHLSGFILSHPLYFSYFIFFSPYLLKLLSFLSPLFITTSLILLLLVLAHNNSASRLSEPRHSFLSAFHVIQQSLRENSDGVSQEIYTKLEECEAYKIVFVYDTPTSDVVEHLTGEECLPQAFDDKEIVVNFSANLGVNSAGEVDQTEGSDPQFMDEKRLEDFFKGLDDFHNNVVEKTVDPISQKSIKVVEEHIDKSKVRKGSEAKDFNIIHGNSGGEHFKKVMSLAKPFYEDDIIDNGDCTSNLGSYGSMRREKEWKRTLACKLFEERHNAVVEGDERIDALWERHESEDLSKSMRMAPTYTNKKKNTKKTTKLEFNGDEEEEEADNEEEFEITKVQLCCLQAFKFSAGKMNLGMGRPNLVKFSKALKGIGWLHHVKRHGKKEKF